LANGQLVCFGENSHGQCDVPPGLGPVVAAAAGNGHTVAVLANGQLVCFGENSHGQCDVPPGLGPVVAKAAGFSQGAESVEQPVVHNEPAAVRDEDATRLQVDEDWALAVERSLHAPQQSSHGSFESGSNSIGQASNETGNGPESGTLADSIAMPQFLLLRFGSAPCGGDSWDKFIELVLHSSQFKPCLDSLELAGYVPQTPQAVLMLVMPEQYRDTCKALVGKHLSPKFNLIIAQDLEYLLEELLHNIGFQRRPKIKRGDNGRQSLLDTTWELHVERTFLCYAPLPRNAASVVQSTTEVVAQSDVHYSHTRGSNPRRSMQKYA